MKKQLLTAAMIAVTSFVILPFGGGSGSEAQAATASTAGLTVQDRRGRGRGRGRDDNYWNRRSSRYDRSRRWGSHRRSRLVRKTFWYNGRRVTRLVRVYY